MIPEMEVFCGEVPVAPYGTPGTLAMSQSVAALVGQHNTVLMGNHGVVSWAHSIEEAYFKMEILDTYCRTVLVARQVSSQPQLIAAAKLRELLTIKQSLGLPDARYGLGDTELEARSGWRPAPAAVSDAETEALVRRITDEVVRALRK
jgi:L-fuculose-phosphate aldolase